MIITKTPVRISFLGGGTDYPDYFRRFGGQTLGASIDKYSYITLNPLANFFDYSLRIGYSKTELVDAVDRIEHPSVRECLRFLHIEKGVQVHYVGDLPARTGLGSSSSFTVGLLHALHAFKGERVGIRQLAEEAVHVEQELIGERVGVQDQYTCAHGGLVHLRFGLDGSVKAAPVPLRRGRLTELQTHLLLFYTGVCRNAHDLLGEQIERTKQGKVTHELKRLHDLVDQGLEVLTSEHPIVRFGELLDAAWTEKKKLSSKISSRAIDAYYERAMKAGAAGGKLLGAGGGGFLLLLAEPKRQAAVEAALPELPRIHFTFEHDGSSILFYRPST